ncbi:MAG TPA: protein kinase, partial [Gemmatimonadales bacterium]|nr:protein kinase [Gemmatimonadales bacterium]
MTGDLLERLQSALGTAYRLEKELGGGGMSRVFLAEETALGRQVVVKVLPPEYGAGLNVDRFRREIQVAAGLHHPHIVPLLSAGQAGDVLYYTMPMIEGESLRARLARHGELPIHDTVRLLRDVVDALACAHEHGVVHRDIKPDNVLLSRKHALVTDFGVAKALEASGKSSITSTRLALGTPAYMAPEQAAADPHTDHRADLYAVGVLAYEMLTGSPPFTGPSAQSVLNAHVTKAPVPVTEARSTVPPGLASLVMRCLEKKPADRYQSADELLAQLELLATPSGGTAPTGAVPVVTPTPTAPTIPTTVATTGAGQRNWTRIGLAAALVLGGLALAYLWPRMRGGSAAEAGGPKTIAVLPLENLGRPEDDYFVDGLTDEIMSRLTGVQRLRVIARTSVNQYKKTSKAPAQIGQELGAEYLLQGTVRWEKLPDGSSEIRVNPALIKASDATNIWARSYDAKLAGIFQVQSQIATEVVSALNVALGESERTVLAEQPTNNPEAFDSYLRGQSYLQRGGGATDITGAIQMLQRAVELDPGFVQARASLAIAHMRVYWFRYDHTPARLKVAETEARRASRDGPEAAEPHLAMGLYYYWGFLDYGKALAELDQAEARKPSDAEVLFAKGVVLRRKGDWKNGLDYMQRSVAVDPRSAVKMMDLANTLA